MLKSPSPCNLDSASCFCRWNLKTFYPTRTLLSGDASCKTSLLTCIAYVAPNSAIEGLYRLDAMAQWRNFVSLYVFTCLHVCLNMKHMIYPSLHLIYQARRQRSYALRRCLVLSFPVLLPVLTAACRSCRVQPHLLFALPMLLQNLLDEPGRVCSAR